VARKYFAASDVSLLFNNFEPYFSERRSNNRTYAGAMESFAARR
jgi:hypothetical protein